MKKSMLFLFIQNAKKYLCNKYLKFHAKTEINKFNQKNEVFIDICKEENHHCKLEFYCKEHNTLYSVHL